MRAALTAEVWSAVRRDLAHFAAHLETQANVVRDDLLLVLTGGPTADFNIAMLEEGANAAAGLREMIGRVRTAGVPAVFMMPSAIARDLAQVARDEGLSDAGTAPLMWFDAVSLLGTGSSFEVQRVETPNQMAVVADLIASAFDLDRAWVARTFAAPALVHTPDVEFWLATSDGEPYSTVTCVHHHGPVGIWSMATRPEHQRKGAGRELLLSVLRHYGRRGFYLIATPPGKPLYDAIGFATLDNVAVWTVGHSEQFAQH